MVFFLTLFVNTLLWFQSKRRDRQSSLKAIVQETTAQLPVKADIYPWVIIVHVPQALMDEAQELLEELGKRLKGFYCLKDKDLVGAWHSPVHGLMLEPICFVTAYATEQSVIENLGPVVEAAYRFGSTNGEEAVAVEVLSPANRLLIVLRTK